MPVVIDGTNGITAPNVYGRNRIINGQGRINQRAYVSGAATTVSNQYTLDRWRVVTSGQNLSFTGNDAGRTMTAPAGGCEQVIEAANIEGGTYVINWTGTATCTVDGTSRAKGATFTLSANSNCTVRFSNGTFTDVQVELGTIPTQFERLSIGDELAMCQRYYQRWVADAAFTGFGSGQGTSTTRAQICVKFGVSMRGSAGISFSNLALADGVNPNPAVTGFAVGNFLGKEGGIIYPDVASGVTALRPYHLVANNNAAAWLAFDSEL